MNTSPEQYVYWVECTECGWVDENSSDSERDCVSKCPNCDCGDNLEMHEEWV